MEVLRVMLLPAVLSLIGITIPSTSAPTCWRDTICTGQESPSFSGVWDANNLSPESRRVSPIRILGPGNSIQSNYPGTAVLNSTGALLIFDFGQEVGGIVTVNYTAAGSGTLGLAFTEARNWTGPNSDSSNGAFGPDGALTTTIVTGSEASYTVPDSQLRGGFRYLSLFTTTSETINVEITSVILEISFQPAWSNLRAYGGYFHSNDDLINRIWYAGAYTLQTNAVPPNTGRDYPLVSSGWKNDAYLGTNGSSVFVDGSKRDRASWAGDLCVAIPSALVSTGDFDSSKNALQLQYDGQQITGELPMVGPPINFFGSDTYHLSTILGTYEYVLYSGDLTFLAANWAKFKLAMSFITAKIDNTSMLSVTGTGDWGRYTQGGHNTEANALMYGALVAASTLATWTDDLSGAATWTTQADALKAAINELNWDVSVGAFKDSDTDASVHPEDGNSLALFYSMANSTHTLLTSTQLTTNWSPIGAICPELPGTIVPYVESMEVKGHLAARQSSRSLDLMRRSWGWYLNNPYGTGSTCIEGYLADGTFGYRHDSGYDEDYSYPSHAHGWSTGPTHALTYYVLGLQMNTPGGNTWTLTPQFGDLISVEGGVTAGQGKFCAKWELVEGGYTISWNMPMGTMGTLVLPGSSTEAATAPKILLNGQEVTNGTYDASSGLTAISGLNGGAGLASVTY